jgi:hypothetical protein
MSELYFEQGPIRPPNFRLGRRAGVYRSLDDLSNSELRHQVEKALRHIELEKPGGVGKVLSDWMESFI